MALTEKVKFVLHNPSLFIKIMGLYLSLRKDRQKRKSTWVFQCDFKGHFPYLKPYYDLLKDDPEVALYFSIGVRDTEESPKQFLIQQGVPKERIVEPADYVALLDFDLYMSPTEWGNIFPKNNKCIRTQIFHTLADKGLEYSKELLDFNAIFMCGPLHHKFMEKYIFSEFPHARKTCQTHNIGYAKLDDLFDGRYDRKELLRSVGIEQGFDRKVVLYAPNWESTSALHEYGEEAFAQLQNSEHIVLIKLHYMSLLSPDNIHATGGVDWRMLIEKYATAENVCAVYDTNINPYLFLADVMVTDYGGASFEFMSMNKPLIYLDCPGFFDERGHDVFEKKARSTGHLINDVNLLNEAVSESLQQDLYAEERQKLTEELLYNRGKAAKTGIALLKERIRNNE